MFDEPGQTAITLISPIESGQGVAARGVSMSADGSEIATNLFYPDAPNFVSEAAIVNLDPANTGIINPVNAITTALPDHEDSREAPRLSRSGRYLTFIRNGSAFNGDLYLLDRETNEITLVSVSPFGRVANRRSSRGIATDDGARVVFVSSSSNLVPLDSNRSDDVFLANLGQPQPQGPLPRECEDQLDNDADGNIDDNDSGCSGPNDDSENIVETTPYSVTVASTNQREGNAVLLDSQGITSTGPSLAISSLGESKVAYQRETYDSSANRMRDFIRLATFDGVYWRSQVIDPGVAPSLAIDTAGTSHIAFHEPFDDDLKYATVNSTETQVSTIDSTGITGLQPTMLLTRNQEPWIVYFDQDDRTIRLWRGNGISQLNLSTDVEPCAMSAALNGQDHVTVAYVECSDDTVRLITTGNSTIARETLFSGLGFRGSFGVKHNVNDEPLITYRSSVIGGMLFARQVAGSWAWEELPDTSRSFSAQVFFEDDGITPNFIVNGPAGLTRVRRLSNGYDSVPLGPQSGAAGQFSAARDGDGIYRASYFDSQSKNLLYTTQNNTGWNFIPVASTPNGGARDLDFFSLNGGQPPSVLTFNSGQPGGLGDFTASGRFPDLGWQTSTTGPVATQDDVDTRVVTQFPELIREMAHFDNVNGELRYLIESTQDVWTAESVTTVERFGQIRDVTIFRRSNFPVIVGVVSGNGGEGISDQLVAYTRQSNGSWTESRLTSSPAVSIGPAAAALGRDGSIYMAYLDNQRGDLRMGTFTGFNWQDEPVDFGGNSSFARAVAITTTVQQRRDKPFLTVPVIAYFDNISSHLHVANRVNNWQFFEYQSQQPLISQLAVVLEADSRLRPIVLAADNSGELALYRPNGDSFVQAQRETVANDCNPDQPVFLALRPTPVAVYTSTGGNTLYGLGSAIPGIPAAREAGQPAGSSVTQNICTGRTGSTKLAFDSTRSLPYSKAQGIADDESTLTRWEAQFSRSAEGQRYIDFFRRDFPRALRIIAADPGLWLDANFALQNFMPGIQAMVEGQGSAVTISQDMVDDARDIWERLADRDSGTLSAFIESELSRWNQMDDFVGMTFTEWAIAIGVDPAATSLVDGIFANGFEP